MKISFIGLFFVLGWMFACVRLLSLTVCHIMNTSCFPTPFRDRLNRFYCPLSAAHRVSKSKISRTISSSLSLKVFWMDFYSEIYDGWHRTARNCGQQLLYLTNKRTKNILLPLFMPFGKLRTSRQVFHDSRQWPTAYVRDSSTDCPWKSKTYTRICVISHQMLSTFQRVMC